MRKLQYILLKSLVFSSVLFAAVSCERIFEGEQDCSTDSTKIKFEFRKHRQALQSVNGRVADVFDSEVASVHLFVYNAESGQLVFEKFERTENLKTEAEMNIGTGSDKCYMPVDLEPGTYKLVVWCGLDENDQSNAFELDKTTRGTEEYEACNVKLTENPAVPVHDGKFDALFHGKVDNVTLTEPGEVIPLQLTKNTNDIAVWVQHLSASFGSGEYEVVYTDANGSMKFEDNTLAGNEKLEYHAHTTSILSTETEYNGDLVQAGALVAHISTSRLSAAHKEDAKLEVRNRSGETVFSIPFIKYLLEMQTFTSDGQYYLDCEDTYYCSFYLSGGGNSGGGGDDEDDEGERWFPARIIINNWVRVPDQTDSVGE